MAADLNYINIHFPSQVITNPAAPYIYFNTLLDTDSGRYIYNAVLPYFSSNLTAQSNGQFSEIDTTNIDAALAFLKSAISSEYAKEVSFINSLKTLLKDDEKQLSAQIPTTTEDWSNFITLIQDGITQSGHGVQNLTNEFNRLKNNHERRAKAMKEKGQDIVYAQKDQITRMSSFISHLEEVLSTKGKKDKTSTIANELYGLILNKYGADLLTIDSSGKPELNRTQLFAVIQAISAIALRDYTVIHYEDDYKGFNWKEFENLLNSDPALDNQISSFISRAKTYPFITEDLMRNLKIINDNYRSDKTAEEYKEIMQYTKMNQHNYESITRIGKIFQNNYKSRKEILDPDAFKLTNVANVYAEILSSINFAMSSGSIYTSNTGSTGAKPDNLLAILNIDLSKLDLNDAQDQEIYQEIIQIRKQLTELNDSLSNVNTTKYYQEQKEKWDKVEASINESLIKIQKKYDFLVNCFIIEDSTKNYLQLEAGAQYDKVSNAFHGGSLGANLQGQIEKIAALKNNGAISMIDAEWLTAAIVNSGPDMIAESKKNRIEQYLAMFATILLFDDQLNIAAEAIHNMAENTQKTIGGVQKIHMFSLNNGYYPLSFVLQLTYDNLYKGYNTLLQNVKTNQGVLVEISGYVNNPGSEEDDKKSVNNWEKTRSAALASTKLKIQFMVNFLQTLNTLLPN